MGSAKHVRVAVAVAGSEPVVVAATVMAIWMGAVFLRQVLVALVQAGLVGSGGASAGRSCVHRWHIVATGGCGMDDGFHGGNPLWVADRLDEVGWRGLWGWIEMRWERAQGLKVLLVVAGIGPGVLHGVIGDQEAMWWWLGMVVAIVVGAECGPQISHP